MKTFLLLIICFLGLSSAQKVKDLLCCQTKEKNLQMECIFEPALGGTVVTCDYMNGNKLVGTTNSSAKPEPTYSNRANVTITNNICRLFLTGFSSDNPENYTCKITQKDIAVKSAIVDKRNISFCSSLSCLFQPDFWVQMAVLMHVVLQLQ